MEIFKAICEIKKLSHSEDKFCERDVHYKVRDNEVKTFLNEMKDFFISTLVFLLMQIFYFLYFRC